MSEKSRFVVSADWLEERLDAPGISIVDASWYLPAQGRDARAEYEAAHIPRAVFFDHDLIADPESDLPHTFPSPRTFERFASSMGISAEDTIVVYDGPGFMAAPRAWWLFRVMGAKNVFVLDGGFDNWKAEGRPVTDEPTQVAGSAFIARCDESKVVFLDEMRKLVEEGAQVADARSAARFTAAEPEPRPGLRGGHMTGAVNVPSSTLAENGRLLPLDRLREKLTAAGLDLSRPTVTSCGSGITAAVIALALDSLGAEDTRLYDGSWTEWAGRPDTPVVTGND
jgi:thiosulfate/3-mercaptopyruvate sulfurtransferase